MLSALDRQLCDLIAARESLLLEQLKEHVAIPTGGSGPGLDQYRERLVGWLGALGARVESIPGAPQPAWLETPDARTCSPSGGEPSIPPTVVARRASQRPTPRVLIVGHLDTVHDPQGPFRELTLSADEQVGTGPGAADMKGGLLVALTALEALDEAGIDLDWSVLINSDEETGSFHSDAALREAAVDHDLGIVVEPALPGGAIVLDRLGSGQFKVEVFGQAAHVGRSFGEGVSAVLELAETIQALGRLTDRERGVIVNVGPLEGGRVTNTVPDYAACWGNVRYADGEAGQRLGAAFDRLATAGDALPRVVVHRRWNRPAKPATEAVRLFVEAVRAVAADLGESLPVASTGGVCDGNILQDEGLPTVDSLGVCGGNLHREDEYVEVPSLVGRCGLLAVLLARIAEGRAGPLQPRRAATEGPSPLG